MAMYTEKDPLSLQDDLHSLEEWQNKWKMKFNRKKFKIMQITTKCDPQKLKFTFCGEILEEVDNHPYLGVEIDSVISIYIISLWDNAFIFVYTLWIYFIWLFIYVLNVLLIQKLIETVSYSDQVSPGLFPYL